MKNLLILAVFAFSCIVISGYGVAVASAPVSEIKSDVVEHGGGCRKDSPIGQCCHMDHSTGIVHCH